MTMTDEERLVVIQSAKKRMEELNGPVPDKEAN